MKRNRSWLRTEWVLVALLALATPACSTFQDATFLCANAEVPADVVYDVMKILWSKEGMEAMTAAKKTFKTMTLENSFDGASIPLHPGAVKFWEEQGMTVPDNLK